MVGDGGRPLLLLVIRGSAIGIGAGEAAGFELVFESDTERGKSEERGKQEELIRN
jgi:hypothetical protein